MFNNNINKPAITVSLPLTSTKTSFCQWQKVVFAGKNYFCRDGFFNGKKRFLPVTGKNLPTLTEICICAYMNCNNAASYGIFYSV